MLATSERIQRQTDTDHRAADAPRRVTCTEADHEDLRAEVADTLAGLRPFGSLTSARAAEWLASRRDWTDAGLIIGECLCRSTIAIEVG